MSPFTGLMSNSLKVLQVILVACQGTVSSNNHQLQIQNFLLEKCTIICYYVITDQDFLTLPRI